jgi:hypothetical protein
LILAVDSLDTRVAFRTFATSVYLASRGGSSIAGFGSSAAVDSGSILS